MTENTQFRSALNGFNREDVVSYLGKINLDHDTAMRKANEENRALKAQLDQANQALEDLRASAIQPEELDALRQAAADAEARLAQANQQVSVLEDQNLALSQEIDRLQQALDTKATQPEREEEPALDAPIPPVAAVIPTPPAADYAERELAAYRRAELTERLARERANDVYHQVQAVFQNASAKFEANKSDLDQMAQTMQMDIRQFMLLLQNIRSAYSEAEASFAAVSERNSQLANQER